jgi:S1-C subfamily serine protease
LTVRQKDGDEVIRELVLRNKEGETSLMSKEEINKSQALGASFADLSEKEKKELNIAYGVKVKTLGAGKLKAVGINEGDVILKVNNEPIETVEELTGKLSGVNRGVLLEIMTESGKRDYKGLGL